MPLGTTLIPDTVANAVGNGQHAELNASAMATKYGGSVHTPTGTFNFQWKDQRFHFYKNVPTVISDAAMLAAMVAAGCPIT